MKYFSNYINFIQTFLLNKNIDNDDTEWQSSKDLSDLATSTATYCITNSIKLKIDCKELILVVKVNHDSIDDTITAKSKL
ncbi:MAG: hypothetical protein U0M06_02860 [Clostridia bacterium]|nr:hypothetical protein [Clostridia bacterium]